MQYSICQYSPQGEQNFPISNTAFHFPERHQVIPQALWNFCPPHGLGKEHQMDHAAQITEKQHQAEDFDPIIFHVSAPSLPWSFKM